MKKILLLLIFIIPITALSQKQIEFGLKGSTVDKIWVTNDFSIPSGANIELIRIIKTTSFEKAYVSTNGLIYALDPKDIEKIEFHPTDIKEFWKTQALAHSVYENIFNKGFQYGLRKDIEEEAIEYGNYLGNNNLLFKDSYLESYLYSLIYKIYPIQLEDGRPGILNIQMFKDNAPNAFIFPNGTIFISTGLLSTINSEEELIGILAHEISHFALDHSIININEAVKREKRAVFWATVATGLAVAADVYVSSNNEYYAPGTITMGTAILSYSIAAAVNERMGLKYSRKQEAEADNCAVELMKQINIEPTALASALNKIKTYSILTGNYLALTGKGTHPSLDSRIRNIGEFKDFDSPNYDRTVSFVNTFNAYIEFRNKHYNACTNLINRNIRANVATEEDYVLLAMVTLFMYDNETKNNEALGLIQKAKSLDVYPILDIPKQEAIALIRLGRFEEANKSLENYRNGLLTELLEIGSIKDSKEWYMLNKQIETEYKWTVKMINKVNNM